MPDRLSVLRGRVPWPATALILAGIAAGIAAREADYAQARWLSDIANYPGTAIFVLALIARFSPTSIEAAARSAGFFAALSLAYYTWGALRWAWRPVRTSTCGRRFR